MLSSKPLESWAVHEFGRAQLGDKRRNDRLVELASTLAQQPAASLPQATTDLAELKAAYRFFDNDRISSQAILQSHFLATRERCADQPLVLVVQDTTLLDFTQHPHTSGLGPLQYEQQHGLLVHTNLAFTSEGLPLGLLAQYVWVRAIETFGHLKPHHERPLAAKESQRWLTSLDHLNNLKSACPATTFVSVGDREADFYDLWVAARQPGVELLIRASQDRLVTGTAPLNHLWAQLLAQPVLGELNVQVPPHKTQPARQAKLTVRFATVELCPPQSRLKEQLNRVSVQAILVSEEPGCAQNSQDPTQQSEPIEWLLLTSLPVSEVEEALQIVSYYSRRWGIEVWHKVLKSGCRIEARQLESEERLERCLSLYSVVAWRIMYLTMLGRSVPELPCRAVLEEAEWQALYCQAKNTNLVPPEPPSLQVALGWIAALGGHLGRKGDGEPGVTVMWRGLARLRDLTAMYQILRPAAAPRP